MSITETSGKERTPHSNDKRYLLTIIELLRLLERPFKYAHVDVRVCTDLNVGDYYRLTKDKNRFTIELGKPDGDIRQVFPELAFAWASMHVWNKIEDGKTRYPEGWGEKVGYCWRIITGETTEVIRDEFRRQSE